MRRTNNNPMVSTLLKCVPNFAVNFVKVDPGQIITFDSLNRKKT